MPAAKTRAFIGAGSVLGFEVLFDVLLAVEEVDLDAEGGVQVLGQVLGGIDGAVLPAGAPEGHAEAGEAALHVAAHGGVDQGVDVGEEGGNLAVVLQEADDGFVQSGEGLVSLVLAGVIDGAAVEDEASAVAGGVVGDAFLVGEAGDADGEAPLLQVVGELLELGQLPEHLAEVGVFRVGFFEEAAQVGDGEGDALHEVGLLLEVSAEAVGAQHLQGAEEDEVAQLGVEVGFVHGLVLAQGVDVFGQQLLAEALGIVGLGLPEEGGDVVVDGALAPALEVDEPGFAVAYHHVAALEVAIHEGGRAAAQEDVGHLAEVVLQAVFLEVQPGGLEEAVFEVVQVPEDGAGVELRTGVAVGEVHPLGPGELEGGQQADGLAQEYFLFFAKDACQPCLLDGAEQQGVAQVFLEVEQLVVRAGMHLGHGQALLAEVVGHVEKGAVFFHRLPAYAYQGRVALQAEIAAVGAGGGHLVNLVGGMLGKGRVEPSEGFSDWVIHMFRRGYAC